MAKTLGKFNRDLALRLLGFFSFVAAVIFCTSRHIPWRDEFQSFLVATRTQSISEFWTATRYERTPPLHYLFDAALWPFLKHFLSARVFLSFVTLSFTFLAAGLLFFRLRTPILFSVLCCFSVFLFREWGVISRSYVLGCAFLWLSLDFRQRGKREISTALLAVASFSHLLFWVGCGILFAEDAFTKLREKFSRHEKISRNEWIFYIGIAGLFAVGLIHQIPPSDTAFQSSPMWNGTITQIGRLFRQLAMIFLPIEASSWATFGTSEGWRWNYNPFRFAFGIPLLGLLIFEFRRDERRWTFLAIGFVLLNLLVAAQGGALRYFAVPWAFFIYFWADAFRRGNIRFNWKTSFLTAGPTLGLICWLMAWNPFNPRFDFSDYKNVADRIDPSKTIFSTVDYSAFGTMARYGVPVFDITKNRFVEYPFFQIVREPHYLSEFCANHSAKTASPGDYLIFFSWDTTRGVMPKLCPHWRQIYQTTRFMASDEGYVLYVLDSPPSTQ